MDHMRRSRVISGLPNVQNEKVRRVMQVDKAVEEEMESRRLVRYGHLRRVEDARWPKRLWGWQQEGKRKLGRQLVNCPYIN